jgi:hypothetical protein
MANFKIDLKIKVGDLIKSIDNLGKDLVQDLQNQIGVLSKTIYNEGLRLADQRLKTTSSLWKDNFKYQKVSDNIYEIYLIDNALAEDFEEGFGSFDMKPGFLNSSKAKTSADGKTKYMDVPFNIKPHAKSAAGERIMDMRSAVNEALKDEAVSKRIEEYNQNSSGLTKFGKVTRFDNIKDEKVKGLVNVKPPNGPSKYFIFRRVSSNSVSSKFMHPGFKGANIFQDLEKYTDKSVDDLIKRILK